MSHEHILISDHDVKWSFEFCRVSVEWTPLCALSWLWCNYIIVSILARPPPPPLLHPSSLEWKYWQLPMVPTVLMAHPYGTHGANQLLTCWFADGSSGANATSLYACTFFPPTHPIPHTYWLISVGGQLPYVGMLLIQAACIMNWVNLVEGALSCGYSCMVCFRMVPRQCTLQQGLETLKLWKFWSEGAPTWTPKKWWAGALAETSFRDARKGANCSDQWSNLNCLSLVTCFAQLLVIVAMECD